MTLRMIDESSWQARTWTAARLKAAGVQVVAVKATEGTSYGSPDYLWQYDQARSAGCEVISYHLARYGDSQHEAQFFDARAYHEPGDILMLDNEAQYITALNAASASAWVSAWTKEVKRLTGAPAVIQYTSRYPVDQGYFHGIREPLFLADPGANPAAPPIVPGWPVSFLQYTARTDQGMQTDVDAAYYGSVEQLRKLGIPQPQTRPVGAGKLTADGTYSILSLAARAHVQVHNVIEATVAARVAEHLAGKHSWVLGGAEAAYLDAGDWSRPLPAGSVWWVP